MTWMLVVLVMGVAPVKTGLAFPSLEQCLEAEDKMRAEVAVAFNRWQQWAAANPGGADYPRSRSFMTRRIGLENLGTCIPHGPLSD